MLRTVAKYCVAEEKSSVQVATKEAMLPKCGQITQNGNCNKNSMAVFEVSKQMKAMEISSESGDKDNISSATPLKRLSIEPSFCADWLEISWDELELKERVGAGTSLPPCLLLIFLYDVKSDRCWNAMQVRLELCIVLTGTAL